jgi:hypothetical protein
MLISFLAYIPNLKMEAICSSEIFTDFQMTTRLYITEERTLSSHPCQNLKSYELLNINTNKCIYYK